MIQIDVTALLVLMGVPTAVTAFAFWLLERNITKRDKERERKAEEARKAEADEAAARRKEDEEREKARESLMIVTVQGVNAAIALGEATARAVQRIPDAHSNGDMKAALEYAEETKHKQKDLLTEQGIHAIY